MFSNHYEITDMDSLHSHVSDYQSNLLNTIEAFKGAYPSDESQALLNALHQEVEVLPYSKLTVFYAKHGV